MFLCYQDEWRAGLKALRADSISKLKKAFPELVQEVILSPQIYYLMFKWAMYVRDLIYRVKKLLCNQELPSNRYIIRYCHLVIVMDNELSFTVDIFLFKCNLADHFHIFYKSRLQGHPISRISTYMHFVIASQVLLLAIVSFISKTKWLKWLLFLSIFIMIMFSQRIRRSV
jgi:hypothetical protein